ncbi:hypothetical protein [Cupriavidus sp. IDO]|uniref:hypothetical protein n=1 Tax=Cupriavidus sp. IDO TaxID=1539142 RepID=UPI000579315F|nr:hypothetical protein [Cupriavidus sp. IDO]KWR89611.1 hypothetical protein RM96_13670 [Cupriavidus sp. IDO]
MSPIIAGRFETHAQAEEAARVLYSRGFSVWDVSIMSVAQGQPAKAPVAGVMLAASVGNGLAGVAADVLREAGASGLERTEGQWECGQWRDFDPAASGEPLDEAQGEYWPRPLAREAVAVESTGNEDPGSELEHFVDRQRASHD